MQRASIAEFEIKRNDWSNLRCGCGDASHMPDSLRALINAESVEDSGKIDFSHHTEISGLLFEVAVPAASVMMAALADGVGRFAESAILSRLSDIVGGEPHFTEAALGQRDLGLRVQQVAREGIWVLYRSLAGPAWRRAQDVLEAIESDNPRFEFIASELRFYDRSSM